MLEILRGSDLTQRSKIDYRILVKLFVLLVVLSLQVNAKPARAQDKITLNLHDASLETVLKEISRQTGYQYAFQDQWKGVAKKISISVTNVSIEDALNICFRDQPFTYLIVKKTIVIREKSISLSEQAISGGIEGKVTTEKGEPLEGASVVLDNGLGTFTNDLGFFKLDHIDKNSKITVSYSGYISKVIKVHGIKFVNLSLSQSSNSLDEIQVIAYGSTTKRLNTGDISSIKADKIEQEPISNAIIALQGRVPGLFVTQSTGIPGSGVVFQLHGVNSLFNGIDPLIIIDGIMYPSENQFSLDNSGFLGYSNKTSGSPLNYVNPKDIASIDILKDADATAIYGSRGANGVILITTKKGVSGRIRLTSNFQTGIGQVAENMKLLDTKQYLVMRHEAFNNDHSTPNPRTDYDLLLWDTTRSSDWQKVLFGGTSHLYDFQSSLSGGNNNTQFLLSTSYRRETTVFPGNANDQKGSLHYDLTSTSENKKGKITLSGMYTLDRNYSNGVDFTQIAMQLAPNAPPLYNSDGTVNWAANQVGVSSWPMGNPAAAMQTNYIANTRNLINNLTVSYSILRAGEIKLNCGFNSLNTNSSFTVPLTFYDPSILANVQNYSTFSTSNLESLILEPQATYSINIFGGKLSSLIGATYQQSGTNSQSLLATGFSSDLLLADPLAANKVTITSFDKSIYKYAAGFGRLNYNLRNKYILNFNIRRDGTSRFGPNTQFHNFASLSTAWIFSEAQLVKRLLPGLDYGKIHASYGTSGSDQVGDYTYLDLYNNINGIGVPYQGVIGLVPASIYNPNLKWEETRKIESGVELSFLKERIFSSFSFYLNHSSSELAPYSIPSITGFNSIESNLNALIRNSGFDIVIKTINFRNSKVSWTTSINISRNLNQLISAPAESNPLILEKVGHALGSYYVYHFIGVNPVTGFYQFMGKDGKAISNPNADVDRISLVDPNPKIYGGVENEVSFNRVKIDFLFTFVDRPQAPIYLYNGIPGIFSTGGEYGSNQPQSVLNRWRTPGDVSTIERFNANLNVSNSATYAQQSDQLIGNGSYIKLKNFSISWTFPKGKEVGHSLNSGKIYINVQNLFTITKYQGLDPETLSSTSLPPLRLITIGGQIDF